MGAIYGSMPLSCDGSSTTVRHELQQHQLQQKTPLTNPNARSVTTNSTIIIVTYLVGSNDAPGKNLHKGYCVELLLCYYKMIMLPCIA